MIVPDHDGLWACRRSCVLSGRIAVNSVGHDPVALCLHYSDARTGIQSSELSAPSGMILVDVSCL